MRVLHVNAKAGFFGGVERILFDTARGLGERGWPQALLHTEGEVADDYAAAFDWVGTEQGQAAAFKPDVVLIHKESDPERVADLARQFPSVRMVHDHDLVCPRRHKYFPTNSRVCAKPAGIACYLNLCFIQKAPPGSVLPVQFKGTAEVKRGLAAHAGVSRFIAISHWMQKELEMNGIDAERISRVNPIPRSLGDVQAASPMAEDAAPLILFVGQVIRGKGVDLLLRSLQGLPGQWRASIVGDGNHLEACQQLAVELGLGERVTFTGWVNHESLNQFYDAARVAVVPSRWPEPFGMVGVEAMARARPVVAFGVGGIPDWLTHGETGLIVPEADTDAMRDALRRLVEDMPLARRLGEQAASDVGQRFTHAAYLDAIAGVLSDAAKGASA